MLGRGGLREEHGGSIKDEWCLLKEAWWWRKTMLEDEKNLWLRNKNEERKEESRSEEKSRRDRIEIRCKALVKERKRLTAKMTQKSN